MPVRVPDRVREVWGDELVVELAPWFQEMIGEYAVPRDEYREVLSRLDRLEKDVSLIKEELAGLRTEMGKLRDQLRAEFAAGQAQLRAEYADGLAQLRAEFADGQAQLRAGFADGQPQVRAEYADGQAQIRAEFREDLGQLRREMQSGFHDMHARFDEMGARFEGRLDEMNHRMLMQTRWLIGSISVLGTVITVLLAIAQFTP